MISVKHALIGGVVAAGVVAGAGLAWASWSGNASGFGNAKARTAATVTVTAATGADDLYPGFTLGDIDFTLTNTNPYPISFTDWTATIIVSSDPTGCPSTNVTVNDVAAITAIAVAAGATNVARSIDDVVTMAFTAPDTCQGDTFTITLALTGAQTAS